LDEFNLLYDHKGYVLLSKEVKTYDNKSIVYIGRTKRDVLIRSAEHKRCGYEFKLVVTEKSFMNRSQAKKWEKDRIAGMLALPRYNKKAGG